MVCDSIDQLLMEIQSLDRPELTSALMQMQCQFPMDFSQEFLDKCSIEKLRHILMAAHLYIRRDRLGA